MCQKERFCRRAVRRKYFNDATGHYPQLKVFLLSLPLVCTIANIMLSNNICDLETDITNHRYTLVYYIGKKQALVVYQVLYAIAFGAILLAVLLGVAPWILLGALVVGVPVYKHIQQFKAVQEKKTTLH